LLVFTRADSDCRSYNAFQNRDISISNADDEIVDRFRELELYDRSGILGGRQLFWTKENRSGFTNEGVRPGDVVCVFNGSVVAYVLRRADEDGDQVERWCLVGEAFVPGLMYGEADGMEVEERDIILV
jgi:hypothetical protein